MLFDIVRVPSIPQKPFRDDLRGFSCGRLVWGLGEKFGSHLNLLPRSTEGIKGFVSNCISSVAVSL